ncbi:ATPase, partial [Fischerella thermalis WC542]
GSGIPAEIAKHIFEKFSQVGKSGRVGLGLYFCRMTAERWGGQIGYLLLPQGGSRFWVRLLKPKPKTEE